MPSRFDVLAIAAAKLMALAGIASIDKANAFIRDVYLPAHNQRFAVEPAGTARPSHRFPASTSTRSCACRRNARS